MIGGGDVCVRGCRVTESYFTPDSRKETLPRLGEKTDRTEKEGGEGDKILEGSPPPSASPTRQMFC